MTDFHKNGASSIGEMPKKSNGRTCHFQPIRLPIEGYENEWFVPMTAIIAECEDKTASDLSDKLRLRRNSAFKEILVKYQRLNYISTNFSREVALFLRNELEVSVNDIVAIQKGMELAHENAHAPMKEAEEPADAKNKEEEKSVSGDGFSKQVKRLGEKVGADAIRVHMLAGTDVLLIIGIGMLIVLCSMSAINFMSISRAYWEAVVFAVVISFVDITVLVRLTKMRNAYRKQMADFLDREDKFEKNWFKERNEFKEQHQETTKSFNLMFLGLCLFHWLSNTVMSFEGIAKHKEFTAKSSKLLQVFQNAAIDWTWTDLGLSIVSGLIVPFLLYITVKAIYLK